MRGCLLVVFALLGSCDRTATQYLIEIDADPVLRARAATITVTIRDADDRVRLDQVERLAEPDATTSLPTRVPVSPEANDASRGFSVDVRLLDAEGRLLGTHEVHVAGFVPGERFVLHLDFTSECETRRCAGPETCLAGQCISNQLGPGEELVPNGDDIQRHCREEYCFEHPLPMGGSFMAACLYDVRHGFVTTNNREIVHLQDERIDVELVDERLRAVACWPSGEVLGVSFSHIFTRGADGWTALPPELPHGAEFRHVFGVTPDDVWVVASDGVWRRRGGAAMAFERVEDPGLGGLEAGNTFEGEPVWFGGDRLVRYTESDGAVLVDDLTSPGAPSRIHTLLEMSDGTVIVGTGSLADAGTWSPRESGWISSPRCNDLALTGNAAALCPSFLSTVWRRQVEDSAFEPLVFAPGAIGAGNYELDSVAAHGDHLVVGSRSGPLVWGRVDAPLEATLSRATDRPLLAIAAGVHGTVAVGPDAIVLERQASSTWTRAATTLTSSPRSLRAVTMDGMVPIAVGDAGFILERRGEATWVQVPSMTEATLRTVIPGLAGGDGGVLLTNPEGRWLAHGASETVTGDIRSLARLDDGRTFVATADQVYELTDSGLESWLTAEETIERLRSHGSELYVVLGHQACRLEAPERCETALRAVDPVRDISLNDAGTIEYVMSFAVHRYHPEREPADRLESLSLAGLELARTPEGETLVRMGGNRLAHLR